MKTPFLLFIIVFNYIACKESPSYNPFDDQFDVSVNQLIADGCDTISAGCGYFNLTKANAELNIYYQVYFDDFKQVVAKGFSYSLDSFTLSEFIKCNSMGNFIDSIEALPIDSNKFNESIFKYGVELGGELSNDDYRFQVVNISRKDTFNLRQWYDLKDDKVVRGLTMFREVNRD